MTINTNKKKYALPIVGVFILIGLVSGVFYAFVFGKDILQAVAGVVNKGNGGAVQFDFQRVKGLTGVSE